MSAESSPRRPTPPYEPPVPAGEGDAPAPVPLADAAAPLPEDPAEQAFSLLLSGELKFRQHNLLEAESYLRRAVDLHTRVPDVDPGERLRALDTLGAVHVARGDLARAEPVLRQALEVAESVLGPAHDDLGLYLNALAHVLFKRRRYAEAEPVLARLVALKRQLGDEHPEVASVVANLAMVHEALQRYDSAETLWRCALGIRERSLPDDSPAVSMAREHLADMCAANGRPEEAIALRELALAARSRALPADHPQLAAARAKLTALRVEGVKARIPVVVPQARPANRHEAAATPQPIMRPPARAATSKSATPPLPRDVLDDIVRATTETPGRGVMAGMRGRAREFLRLVKPRADAPDDVAARADDAEDEEEFDAPVTPVQRRPAKPAGARPLPRVVMPVAAPKRLADAAPDAWEDEDEAFDPDVEPDDGDDEPPRRFDLFGDSMWPKTRIALTVLALTLVLAVAAAGVARMAGGSPPEQAQTAGGAPPAATPGAPASAVGPETRRVMDAGLRAVERAANSSRASGSSTAP
jgi:tetratricopeptide (TPR) repeat protein